MAVFYVEADYVLLTGLAVRVLGLAICREMIAHVGIVVLYRDRHSAAETVVGREILTVTALAERLSARNSSNQS